MRALASLSRLKYDSETALKCNNQLVLWLLDLWNVAKNVRLFLKTTNGKKNVKNVYFTNYIILTAIAVEADGN